MVGDCIDVAIALLFSCEDEGVSGMGYGAVRLLILGLSFRTVCTLSSSPAVGRIRCDGIASAQGFAGIHEAFGNPTVKIEKLLGPRDPDISSPSTIYCSICRHIPL